MKRLSTTGSLSAWGVEVGEDEDVYRMKKMRTDVLDMVIAYMTRLTGRRGKLCPSGGIENGFVWKLETIFNSSHDF